MVVDIEITEKSENKLSKDVFNNFVVSSHKKVQLAKQNVIHKLTRIASALQKKKTQSNIEEQKNLQKSENCLKQISALKALHTHDIAKLVVLIRRSFQEVFSDINSSLEERVLVRVAQDKELHYAIEQLQAKYPNLAEEALRAIKGLGVNYRQKRLKSLKEKGQLQAALHRERMVLLLASQLRGREQDSRLLVKGEKMMPVSPFRPSSKKDEKNEDGDASEDEGGEEEKASEDEGVEMEEASEDEGDEEEEASEDEGGEEEKACEDEGGEEEKASEDEGGEEEKASEDEGGEEEEASEDEGGEEEEASEDEGGEEEEVSEDEGGEEEEASEDEGDGDKDDDEELSEEESISGKIDVSAKRSPPFINRNMQEENKSVSSPLEKSNHTQITSHCESEGKVLSKLTASRRKKLNVLKFVGESANGIKMNGVDDPHSNSTSMMDGESRFYSQRTSKVKKESDSNRTRKVKGESASYSKGISKMKRLDLSSADGKVELGESEDENASDSEDEYFLKNGQVRRIPPTKRTSFFLGRDSGESDQSVSGERSEAPLTDSECPPGKKGKMASEDDDDDDLREYDTSKFFKKRIFRPDRGRGRFQDKRSRGRGTGRFEDSRGRGMFQDKRGRGTGRFEDSRGRGMFQDKRGRGTGRFEDSRGRGRFDSRRGGGRFQSNRGRGREGRRNFNSWGKGRERFSQSEEDEGKKREGDLEKGSGIEGFMRKFEDEVETERGEFERRGRGGRRGFGRRARGGREQYERSWRGGRGGFERRGGRREGSSNRRGSTGARLKSSSNYAPLGNRKSGDQSTGEPMLHPSWLAKKMAQSASNLSFHGKRKTFDD